MYGLSNGPNTNQQFIDSHSGIVHGTHRLHADVIPNHPHMYTANARNSAILPLRYRYALCRVPLKSRLDPNSECATATEGGLVGAAGVISNLARQIRGTAGAE